MNKNLNIGVSLSGFDSNGELSSLLTASGYNIVRSDYPLKDDNSIADYFSECEVLIAGSEPLNQLIERSQKLKLILRAGVGTDNFSTSMCKDKKITWVITENQVADSVSNYVLGNILVITSGLYQNQIIKSPTWRNEIPKGLEGSIIGIVGLGRIGLVLLNKLIQFPFLKIYVNDIFDLDFEQIIPERYRDRVEQVDLETCLSNSDIVTLHVPLTTTTKNLINEEVLSVMTKTSWLINTSRGEIIDEVALYNALTNQTLGGAVLDVFAEEPYDGPLIGIPNAVLTPHIGTYNLHARREMESFLVNKALDFSLECSDLNFVERL